MNSFRVISNVKLIVSNLHKKKNHKHFCLWFLPMPIIHLKVMGHVPKLN